MPRYRCGYCKGVHDLIDVVRHCRTLSPWQQRAEQEADDSMLVAVIKAAIRYQQGGRK